MDSITEGFRRLVGSGVTTYRENGRYVSGETAKQRLSNIGASSYLTHGKVCFVLGMGSHKRSTYEALEKLEGVSLVLCRSMLPFGLRFIPSYRGLLKIDRPSSLFAVVDTLMDQGMVGVYLFDANMESGFVDAVQARADDRDESFGIRTDPGYLIYIVEGDLENPEGGERIVEFLSYGKDGPWKDLF